MVEVAGVVGPFDRTPEAWRALGGSPSLWDEMQAAQAWRRCAPPGHRLDSFGPLSQPFLRRLLAHRWWANVRPHFLATVGGLTPQERAQVDRAPRFYRLSGLDEAAVDRELFASQREAYRQEIK